jgi:hypothetical protein
MNAINPKSGSKCSNGSMHMLTQRHSTNAVPAAEPDFVAQRWGPSLTHDDPPITVPADHWRWRVASLPRDRWGQWRRRVLQILKDLGHAPSATEIRLADQQAAAELGVAGALTTLTTPGAD